jgi:serine/threonine protein kinase
MSIFYMLSNSLKRNDCEFLTKSFDLKLQLGKGAFGSVGEICHKGDDDCYALKTIVYSKEIYELSGVESLSKESIKLQWENEIKILTKLNVCQDALEYKFVPIFYDSWLCEDASKTFFYILMEKFEGNLDDFIKKYKFQDLAKTTAVAKLELLESQLGYIHSGCNICLNDIKLENILYKQVGKYVYEFVFADTGKSTDETNLECKKEDKARFKRTIKKFVEGL